MTLWPFAENPDLLLGAERQLPTAFRRRQGEPPVNITFSNRAEAFKIRLMGHQSGYIAQRQMRQYYKAMAAKISFAQALEELTRTDTEGLDPSVPRPVPGAPDFFKGIGIVRSMQSQHNAPQSVSPWLISLLPFGEGEAIPLEGENDDEDDEYDYMNEGPEDGSDKERGEDGRKYLPLVSVYPRSVPRFSGIYVGSIIGVTGQVIRRGTDGNVTGVALSHIVTPAKIEPSWSLPNIVPLRPANASRALTKSPKGLRVHVCSGPYPRECVAATISSIIACGVSRGADVIVMFGPFVELFAAHEQSLLENPATPGFIDTLIGIGDTIDNALTQYATKHIVPRVVVVPSLSDATALPVLPQPQLDIQSDERIFFASNPMDFVVDGVRFSVCSYDIVSEMRERMTERWHTIDGSLARVCDALVQSRMLVPPFELPLAFADMNNFEKLTLNSLPKEEPTEEETEKPRTPFFEKGEIPHILLTASTKPKFAFMTHSLHLPDLSSPGDGVLVVNPSKWNMRQSAHIAAITIAEISIKDSGIVSKYGPMPECGVSVGTLRVNRPLE